MLTTKITYELAEWIRECIELINESPSIESCYKFVELKDKDSVISEIEKIQIEAILLYETSE